METTYKTFFQLVGAVRTWISGMSEPPNVSRDFWMPDQSCLVCYECDSQFTLFNRRHHCRLCGRVFCGKCTENSVPSPEEGEKIRACNFCYRQWEQALASVDDEIGVSNLVLESRSPSALSFASAQSSVNFTSSSVSLASMPYSFGPYQQSDRNSGHSSFASPLVDVSSTGESNAATGKRLVADSGDLSSEQHIASGNSGARSEDGDSEYSMYRMDSEAMHYSSVNAYRSCPDYGEMSNDDRLKKVHLFGENMDLRSLGSSPLEHRRFDSQDLEGFLIGKKEDENYIGDECVASSSLYVDGDGDSAEPVDFENNGLLWLPPEPEDEEDEKDNVLFDDDDDYGNSTGEWGYLRASSSFGSGESRIKDRMGEEQKNTMKNVVDGHFRALVAQLLQVENLLTGEEDDKDNWLEIVTSLSWEAATLLKPDMSKGGGMDPGGYVKVKCLASGHRRESTVIKGVVCKKNVAHRRMTTQLQKPRIFILGGALEYQRVTNHLSSFDTLLQQEMDHLRMAVAKIAAHNPDLLLVEKSVSRFAQDYLLEKEIALVLNMKRPLLERISRCTGSPIVPSIDHLSAQKLGYCERFRVEKFQENLGTAGQDGKKTVKTLMYFEGCPKPLGCTVLLRGANGDVLKKVKHVIQYGVFAAYHLALETSFLADEGASLPELSLNSPLPVAFSDKLKSMDKSISTVFSAGVKSESAYGPQRSNSVPTSDLSSYIDPAQSYNKHSSLPTNNKCLISSSTCNDSSLTEKDLPDTYNVDLSPLCISGDKNETRTIASQVATSLPANDIPAEICNTSNLNVSGSLDASEQGNLPKMRKELRVITKSRDGRNNLEESAVLQDEQEPFPPSPSDNQSILVSLSSRCIWKGTVCERSHLFRIKYYASSDKPLGRFLRDHLFDQTYQCHSCEMPSEAHVQCYTHRQGTLTISVKRLPEILLPGEKEGKIWMWHRCLVCPRINGFPPATRRIIMSDAAWGLSFGKFLELSFSNHAAASRVASCGHSLHRDCLRFYGFGKMVACFRYAAIDILSVYLPPSKLDFNYGEREWMREETEKVIDRVELLFSEALNALSQISEKRTGAAARTSESRRQISKLEELLQKEKQEFEELLLQTLNRETKKGQPIIDILETNRLRRQLLFQSYMWDQRLIYAASLDNQRASDQLSRAISEPDGKSAVNSENIAEKSAPIKTGKGYNSFDSFLVDQKSNKSFEFPVLFEGSGDLSNLPHPERSHEADDKVSQSPSTNSSDSAEKRASAVNMRKTRSEGEFHSPTDLSDTLDAAWTGGKNPMGMGIVRDDTGALSDSAREDSSSTSALTEKLNLEQTDDHSEVCSSLSFVPSTKSLENMEDSASWLSMPFVNFYRSLNKSFFASSQKLQHPLGNYNPVYIYSFRESELQCGARMLLPAGVNDTVVPVYDDEPTSVIAYALAMPDYHLQLSDDMERPRDSAESLFSALSDSLNFQSFHSSDDTVSESHRSLGSFDESFSSLSGSRSLDPVTYTKALHARVSFGEDGPLGKVKYSVTCYYAKRFEALRRICCPSELDFIRSLSRCKKWRAEGGKSNVFFAKTLDDRFIIKQVTKTELESFIKFAPEYFRYLSESIITGSPTCLAKILGIYQVTSRHLKGPGVDVKMDVLVMENLMYGRNVRRLYDLKGSARSRYSDASDKVLLDQNLIEAMPTSPIFLGTKAKRSLERAVWNDTAFLASVDVMDYSLLVGLDEDNHELVLGIIDFMRQYTWDKHLETWVKNTGILGGPRNAAPTVISPKQYKKRFRKAMTTYFLMVPDQWFRSSMVQSQSQSDLGEENSQGGGTPAD